eukprot:scaffold7876_cov70-Skeletonema_dohrnii-CCMP3373.AAC.2
MRSYRGSSFWCACESELCQKIGYSHDGMFCFPADDSKCTTAMRLLGIQSPDHKAAIANNPRHNYIAPWHFHRNHLTKKSDGRWAIQNMEKFTDNEGKTFGFAPPNGNVQQFIDQVILPMGHSTCRGGFDILPTWFTELTAKQANIQQHDACSTPRPKSKVARVMSTISAAKPRPLRKRESPEKAEIRELKEKLRENAAMFEAKLNSAFEENHNLKATVKVLEDDKLQLSIKVNGLERRIKELEQKIEKLEKEGKVISYDDLKPGGTLANSVKDFTFFPNYICNEAFLDVINHTSDRPAGKGVCENMKRYHHMTVGERVKYNDGLREALRARKEKAAEAGTGTEAGGAGEDLDEITVEAMEVDDDLTGAAVDDAAMIDSSRRKLHWKTEYLVYCFFARCNISMTRIAALFGIGRILVRA